LISTQLRPQPQRKTMAATKPRKGKTIMPIMVMRAATEVGSSPSAGRALFLAGLVTDSNTAVVTKLSLFDSEPQCCGEALSVSLELHHHGGRRTLRAPGGRRMAFAWGSGEKQSPSG